MTISPFEEPREGYRPAGPYVPHFNVYECIECGTEFSVSEFDTHRRCICGGWLRRHVRGSTGLDAPPRL